MTGIIIFALAAIFMGLRLYAVLGKRTGHEQGFRAPEEKTVPPIVPVAGQADTRERSTPPELGEPVATDDRARDGLRAISSADRTFVLENFVDGASAAYRMILEAFWAGDLSPVEAFIGEDVKAAFGANIAERIAAGERLDNKLVAIEQAVISEASLEAGVAQIIVRFDADIAAVTRDKDGVVIAGSVSDAVATHDVWTFSKTLKSRDPNWILTDTDEAA